MSDVTADVFLGGAVTVFQPKTGFRAGTDSVLLAAALDARETGEALEFGCGAGGALLPAASRLASARLVGLEIDPDMAALARRGASENALSDRVSIVEGDAGAPPPDWRDRFGLVFSNPPFFADGAITPPGTGKARAFVESVPLATWISGMLFATRPKGRIVMIHRAAALTDILSALKGRAGEIEIMPVRPCPGADANRVIVRARKGLRPGPTRLCAGIDLYEFAGGPRSAVAVAMATHGEGLSWDRKS